MDFFPFCARYSAVSTPTDPPPPLRYSSLGSPIPSEKIDGSDVMHRVHTWNITDDGVDPVAMTTVSGLRLFNESSVPSALRRTSTFK